MMSNADWMVRPAGEAVPEAAPKLVGLLPREPRVQCGHLSQSAAASEWLRARRPLRKDWRLDVQDFSPENCALAALYTVAGLPVCSRHAGLILLDACLEMGI